uniref:Tetraspanin-6 n=1 Tax=Aceria tosichella TaxID=561515 RepID=A0A6G1SNV8_9ACAR
MSFFGTIGRFVSEFARFILFFACIIFLACSSFLLAVSYRCWTYFDSIEVKDLYTGLSIALGFSIYLTILALIGIFASFFSSSSAIKLLAFMTTLNVVIGIAVLASSSSKVDVEHRDLFEKLQQFEKDYDWDHKSSSSKSVKFATAIWDDIQPSLECCGLDSPDDWFQYEPASIKGALPMSCCKNVDDTKQTGGYCYRDKSPVWSDGCSKKIVDAFGVIMGLVLGIIIFNVVMGALAMIVLCCNPHQSTRYNENVRY